MCAYLKPKTCQNIRVFAVVLDVKFSLNPNLRSKTSLIHKHICGWLMLLPKADFTLLAID